MRCLRVQGCFGVSAAELANTRERFRRNASRYVWKTLIEYSDLPRQQMPSADSGKMAMSKASTGDIILQGGRKVDLRERSLSSLDVAALAKLISTSTIVEALSLYNVRLSSEVSATRTAVGQAYEVVFTSPRRLRIASTLPHCCCCCCCCCCRGAALYKGALRAVRCAVVCVCTLQDCCLLAITTTAVI